MRQIKSKSIIVQAKKYNEIYFFLLDTKSILNKEFDSIKIKNSITKLEKLSIDKDFIGLENNRLEQIKIRLEQAQKKHKAGKSSKK